MVTGRDLWGASVLVLGLLAVAGATGFVAGRRRAAVPVPPPG
jgi:hypothetical protein